MEKNATLATPPLPKTQETSACGLTNGNHSITGRPDQSLNLSGPSYTNIHPLCNSCAFLILYYAEGWRRMDAVACCGQMNWQPLRNIYQVSTDFQIRKWLATLCLGFGDREVSAIVEMMCTGCDSGSHVRSSQIKSDQARMSQQ